MSTLVRLAVLVLLVLARPGRGRRHPRHVEPATGPIRIIAVNAPRWTPKKRWVVSVVVQAARLRRFLNRNQVDVAGIVESYAAQRAQLNRGERWGVWGSRPNPGGPGQALVHRRTPRRRMLQAIDAETISTPYARYAGNGGLHQGMRAYSRGGHEVTVAVMHLPRPADDTEHQAMDQVRTVERALPRRGAAVITADVNRRPGDVLQVLGDEWRLGASSDVMAVYVRSCAIVGRGVISKRYRWWISDHTGAPFVDVVPLDDREAA